MGRKYVFVFIFYIPVILLIARYLIKKSMILFFGIYLPIIALVLGILCYRAFKRHKSCKAKTVNLELIGTECIKLLQIDKAQKIKFKARQDIPTSFAEKVNGAYLVNIKERNELIEIPSVVHELCHIKGKHLDISDSDFLMDFLYFPLEILCQFHEIRCIRKFEQNKKLLKLCE